MPTFLEHDRTSSEVRRIITADETPEQVAHLVYQQVPEGVEIDLTMSIEEILGIIADAQSGVSVKAQVLPRMSSVQTEKAETPAFVEL